MRTIAENLRLYFAGEFDGTFSNVLAGPRAAQFMSAVERTGINATVPHVLQPPAGGAGFRLRLTYNIGQYILRILEFRAIQVDTFRDPRTTLPLWACSKRGQESSVRVGA